VERPFATRSLVGLPEPEESEQGQHEDDNQDDPENRHRCLLSSFGTTTVKRPKKLRAAGKGLIKPISDEAAMWDRIHLQPPPPPAIDTAARNASNQSPRPLWLIAALVVIRLGRFRAPADSSSICLEVGVRAA